MPDLSPAESLRSGFCDGCDLRFQLTTDGLVPMHMWPYSTPLMIRCNGSEKEPTDA